MSNPELGPPAGLLAAADQEMAWADDLLDLWIARLREVTAKNNGSEITGLTIIGMALTVKYGMDMRSPATLLLLAALRRLAREEES